MQNIVLGIFEWEPYAMHCPRSISSTSCDTCPLRITNMYKPMLRSSQHNCGPESEQASNGTISHVPEPMLQEEAASIHSSVQIQEWLQEAVELSSSRGIPIAWQQVLLCPCLSPSISGSANEGLQGVIFPQKNFLSFLLGFTLIDFKNKIK